MNPREIIKKAGFLLDLIPTKLLIGATNKKILLPFYHAVSNEKLHHIDNLYSSRNVELFIEDLEFFCKYFKTITIDELYQIIVDNKKISQPVFHLTFDDGLREVYTVIAPILAKKGIPATFFVNTDFIDNKSLFFRYKISLIIDRINKNADSELLNKLALLFEIQDNSLKTIVCEIEQLQFSDLDLINEIGALLNIDFKAFLSKVQPYLNTKEINELKDKGFTFGSHSLNHPLFKNLNFEEQKRQIAESFSFLSKQFGCKNKYFSFPFSDDKVRNNLFKWMYDVEKCRLTFGISGLKRDANKFHLHRIQMENNFDSAEKIVKTEYLYYILKIALFKNKIKRYD